MLKHGVNKYKTARALALKTIFRRSLLNKIFKRKTIDHLPVYIFWGNVFSSALYKPGICAVNQNLNLQ